MIEDTYDFTEHFNIDDIGNWDRVIVGWYHLNGQRLLIQDEEKNYWTLIQRNGN